MVFWLKALNLDFCCVLIFIRGHKAYPLHYGVCTQYIFCSYYGKDWYLTINYWRGNWMIIDPLHWYSQASCLLIKGTCSIWLIFSDRLSPYQGNLSTWLIFSDKLSPYQGNLLHLSEFPRQALYTSGDDCFTWVNFPDKLSPLAELKYIFKWFLVLISCRFERIKKKIHCSI